MFEKILSQIRFFISKHTLPYMVVWGQAVLLKNPDIDLPYIREWLKKFDESSEERGFLKTFEEIVKEL
jgi:hypothetical protein